jgi:hypothetical protein
MTFGRTLLTFGAGIVGGIYLTQNYRVPDITRVFGDILSKAKKVEVENRR